MALTSKKTQLILSALFALQNTCAVRHFNAASAPKELLIGKKGGYDFHHEVFRYNVDSVKGDQLVRTKCLEKAEYEKPKNGGYHDGPLILPKRVTKDSCSEEPASIPFTEFEKVMIPMLEEMADSAGPRKLLQETKAKLDLREMYKGMLQQTKLPTQDQLTHEQNQFNANDYEIEIKKLENEIALLELGGTKDAKELFAELKATWAYTLEKFVKTDHPFLVYTDTGPTHQEFFKNFQFTLGSSLMGKAVSLSFEQSLKNLIKEGVVPALIPQDPLQRDLKTLAKTKKIEFQFDKLTLPSNENSKVLVYNKGLGGDGRIPFDQDLSKESLGYLKDRKDRKTKVCKLKALDWVPKVFALGEDQILSASGTYVNSPEVTLVDSYPFINFSRVTETIEGGVVKTFSILCGNLIDYNLEEKKRFLNKSIFQLKSVSVFPNDSEKADIAAVVGRELVDIFTPHKVSFSKSGDKK